jgi:hypothetical protein
MNAQMILTAFNDTFDEFVQTVVDWFPEDADILATKTLFAFMRKTNPKLIVKAWHGYVSIKYSKEIDEGNISFFIDKDYKSDLSDNVDSDKIIESINRLRFPIQNQSKDVLFKVAGYLKILNNLCNSYFFTLSLYKKGT